MSIKARQARLLIIRQSDLTVLQESYDKLRAGQDLTALESGVVAYSNVSDVVMVDGKPPEVRFDGFFWTLWIWTAS